MNSNAARYILVLLLVVAITFFSRCMSDNSARKETAYNSFTTDATCESCHSDVYKQHLETAHFASSAPADTGNIKGSFAAGTNAFLYNPGLMVKIEAEADSLFQNVYSKGKKLFGKSIDITIGSGTKGHSFLSWAGDKLVQLPITYFTPSDAWSTSPGFAMNKPEFNRIASSRCLECHITYAEKTGELSPNIESYDSSKMIFRIGCQRCHGAGKMHTDYHNENPEEKDGKFIVNPKDLERARKLDLCGLCHNGAMEKLKPSFSFTAGDTLANYFVVGNAIMDAGNIDVHGNQLGLLSQSKCFTVGKATCQSCHEAHKNERDQLATFSNRCLNCHGGKEYLHCTFEGISDNLQKQNCIDCHMPKQNSRSVAVMLQGAEFPTPAQLRNHFIKVYPNESAKIEAFIKGQKHAK